MWFNSTQREEPYQGLTLSERPRDRSLFGDTKTGGAWLSSARVVRCWVKSRNERNPYPMLPARKAGTHRRLPGITWRKAGMTSSHHAPYVLGYTRTTMVGNKGQRNREVEQIPETRPQFGSRLQPAYVKLESLVIAGQHTAVNTFRALYTPPVTPRKLVTPEAGEITF